MTVLITLTTAGIDSGPFNLYSNVDGYITPFATGISRLTLLAGYTSSVVPTDTNIIRLQSSGICINYEDVTVDKITTTTTTTTSGPIEQYMTLFGQPASALEACANIASGLDIYTTRYSVNLYMQTGDILYDGPGLTNPKLSSEPLYYGYMPGGQVFFKSWIYVDTNGVVLSSGYCS